MKLKTLLLTSFIFLFSPNLLANNSFITNPEVKSFINEMVTKHNFEAGYLEGLFANTSPDEYVITAMSKPYEALPWHKYKKLFITDSHVMAGKEFWQKNERTLAKAEAKYGVPAEIIVAIIGVETRYGKNMGKHNVFQSLATLAFNYPPRAKFFRSELEEFLLLSKEQQYDPLSIKGSYAGAMGQSQFIASSYRHYAVDFSNDGHKDLINNADDAIGSVANYFKRHNWQQGEAVYTQAEFKSNNVKEFNTLKLDKTIKSYEKLGVYAKDKKINKNANVMLMKFEEAKNDDYFFGFNNFYVITRYNHSVNYARAVYELSNRLREARKA